jgi:4-amino-4-deoxy-L-arabinose transferase-like glycosyltransferase
MLKSIRNNLSLIILLAILIFATLLRLYNVSGIWSYYYHDFDGAFNSIIARNYLRYGWLKIKFAQILDVGPLDPDSIPYTHHPPLMPILLSISFRLFGIHEWSARLVPIMSSLGAIIALYLLASEIWNKRTALFACFFMSFIPMASYYGPVPGTEASISLLSVILTTYLYILYIQSPRPLHLILMILSFLFGAIADWHAFYTPLLLSLHYVCFTTKARKHKTFFMFPVIAFLVFILLFFVYPKILTGSYLTLIPKVIFRAGASVSDLGFGENFTFIQWLNKIFGFYLELYTVPVLILTLIWFLSFIYKAVKRRNLEKDVFVIILLVLGTTHIVLFREGAWIHAYWSALLIPGLSIASALPLATIYDLISKPSRKYRTFLRDGFLLATVLFAAYCTFRLHSLYQVHFDHPYDYWYRFGTTINENSKFNDGILISEDIDLRYTPQLEFYADRDITAQITNLKQFYSLYGNNFQKYRYFILPVDQQMVHRALYEFLDKSFSSKTENGFIIFDLKNEKTDDENISKYLQIGKNDYYFLDHMNDAVIVEEKEGYVRARVISVDEKPRKVIYLHPNSTITFRDIPIRENSSLSFGIGINQLAWNKKGDGVQFKVIVTSRGKKTLIFSKYINPKAKMTERKWHDFTVDLQRFRNQEISITLKTQSGPKNNIYFDWAGWSNPQIISRPNANQKLNQNIKAGIKD